MCAAAEDNSARESPVRLSPGRRAAWVGLLLIILISFAIVGIPAFLIQPFKPQTQRALEISYLLRRWSPVTTVVACIAMLFLVIKLWSFSRWWSKGLLLVLLLLTFIPLWFARQNHFEWLFNPLAHGAYATVSEANFVGDSDMLLAVKINNEAVAYPVRLMAYHHVVQDTVGGTPICATY